MFVITPTFLQNRYYQIELNSHGQIVSLYDRLIVMAPSPVVALNRAIAIGGALPPCSAARYAKVLAAADGYYDVLMPIFGDPIPGASEVLSPGKCELVAYLGGADVERRERALMHERKIAGTAPTR